MTAIHTDDPTTEFEGGETPITTEYTVWHPMEFESHVDGGVAVSTRQQRVALDAADISHSKEQPEEYDLLHLNFPGPISLSRLLAAQQANTPVVVHAHSIGENIRDTFRLSGLLAPAINRYFSWFYRQADRVIAVSEYMAERLAANGVTEDVVVVSNGVDADALDGHERLDGLEEKYDANSPVAVNLAQVYDIKGVGDFIETGCRLSEVDFRWFGPKHALLSPKRTKRTVESAPPNVRFPGFIEDKREAFALGDVFFFPTHRDNQPLAILEALYCGLPIVTRDIPAFRGWLEHGENCLKGDSVDEFAGHIRRLAEDPDLRERLSANARETAAEHTLDSVGQQLRDVYEDVLDPDRTRRARVTQASR